MGLLGNSSSNSSSEVVSKRGPAIIVDASEEIKRKAIKMDKHAKAVKVTEGHSKDPVDDSPQDNLFLALYKDPDTLAPLKRTIYLSRHGESQFNLYGKIGGNSSLSSQGLKYAIKLADHFDHLKLDNFQVWTSELVRTHQTTQYIRAQKIAQPQLNEIDSGDFDGMTYEDVAEQHPI